MALIVHIRPDQSLALDSRSDAPATHALPVAALQRWGVKPGHDFTLTTEDGEVVYTFSTFGRKIQRGEEVADHKVLVYERAEA
jgi:hypothetical protein